MELTEAMRTTASTRLFGAEAVADEILYRVLDNARFAPSSGNRQGWRVIVVRDPVVRTRLKELYLRSWQPVHLRRLEQTGNEASRRHLAGANHYAEHLDEVPVHLVVIIDPGALVTGLPALDQSRLTPGSSIYPFVQNILLGLRAEGLGGALTLVLNSTEAEVKSLLNVPADLALVAHIGVGWPADPHPTRLRRRRVEDFATCDRFGGEPFSARA